MAPSTIPVKAGGCIRKPRWRMSDLDLKKLQQDSKELHERFWRIWTIARAKMPKSSNREMMAADHAAWLMFQALEQPKTQTTQQEHYHHD